MVDIRIGQGVFSYATGSNLGDGAVGGADHKANVAGISAFNNDLVLTLPTDDYTLNAGETIGFSYLDASGNQITVTNAVIQQTGFTDGDAGPNMSGILTAVGTDQNGNQTALILRMDGGGITAGMSFFDTDPASSGPDVFLDKPITSFYLGNYADVDPIETNGDAENAANLVGASAAYDGNLALVDMQPQDAHNTTQTTLGDNDQGNSLGDRITYVRPTTGDEVSATIDSTLRYNADVLLGDGTTFNTLVTVIQMVNGDVFVVDPLDSGTLDGKAVQSITLTSLVGSNFNGFFDTQSVEGARVACFGRGTRITTQSGIVAVEDLSVGDLVLTMDNGFQPIRWIRSSKLDSIDLKLNPKLRPIRIKAGALGRDLPGQDLTVSPQHRMMVSSAIAERMFGEKEVLIPANKLLPLDGIDIVEDADSVEYFHMLFNDHEIVFANGAPSESLFTGPEALKSLPPEAYKEITTLFPDVLLAAYDPHPARHIPEKGRLMRALAQRHQNNGKPLYMT